MWRLLQILEKRGYQVQLRGVVPVKGKGNMETYYVMGRKAGHAPGFVRQPSTYSSLATVVYGMLQARRRQTIKKSATSKWHLRVMYELTNPYRFHIQNPTGLSLHFLNKNTVLFLGDTESCCTSGINVVVQSVGTGACSTSCTSMVGQSVWPAACSSNPWWQTSVENWRNDKWQWKTELQSLKKTWLNATFVHHKSHMACFGIKSDTVKITCNSKSGC